VLTVVTQGVMLFLGTLVLLLTGGSVQTLWNAVPLGPASGMLFYHLVMIHGLFFAPFFGWLLLVSAWSRRAAFLWAILPPLALSLGERIAFNTTHFATMLMSGIEGGPAGAPVSAAMVKMQGVMTSPSPAELASNPRFWIGLLVTAAFLAGAVRLRRSRGPL
jgi:ABC-2 type transport system permease protein